MATATTPADAAASPPDAASIAARGSQIAAGIAARLQHRGPSVLERRWWEDHMIAWATNDEAVRLQMFRFVDALPMLRTHDQIVQHLTEFHADVARRLPSAEALAPGLTGTKGLLGRVIAYNARRNVTRMAGRFLAGETIEEIAASISQLRRRGLAFGLRWLSGPTISEKAANVYAEKQLELLDELADVTAAWPDDIVLDRTATDYSPRFHLAISLSSLAARFDGVSYDNMAAIVLGRLRPILTRARELDAHIHFETEPYRDQSLVLDLIEHVLSEDDYADWPHVSVEVSAASREAGSTIDRLEAFAAKRGTPMSVRLSEGLTRQSEAASAWRESRPSPIFVTDDEVVVHFADLASRLLADTSQLRPAFATHHVGLIGSLIATAEALETPTGDWELQTVFGLGEDLAQVLGDSGHRVRVLAPCGSQVRGMAAIVQPLLQNRVATHLLRRHMETDFQDFTMPTATLDLDLPAAPPAFTAPPSFENEPLTDWTDTAVREAMSEALEYVRSELGAEYPLVIDGKAVDGRGSIVSRDPSNKKTVVGKAASASPDQASEAVESASRAFETWSRRSADELAEYLEVVAAELRSRRFELASWIVVEAGRDWAQADIEVADAIDFCMFYAREARRMAGVDAVQIGGQNNETEFRPRGVVVAMPAWNSPLAALTGMTAAALATGNTVVMKPAEQTSVVAAKLFAIFRDAGLPSGVVNYVPGETSEIGPVLASHPIVAVLAFSGSAEMGQTLNEAAASSDGPIKQRLFELGGKNAIIVDDDADLDAAVTGVLESAFLGAGQLASSCSRVIVLKSIKSAFLKKLEEAAQSLRVGDASDPATQIGPVISEEAFDRLVKAFADANDEADFLISSKPEKKTGFFVGPHIAYNVPEEHFLTTEQISGPLLAVQSARTFDDALSMATTGQTALVAGLYSRSPERIATARRELRAGNIVINRPTVGAMVARQPFGGYAMSGLGTKAGGSDYLRHFVVPVTVSEDYSRQGFVV